MNKDLMLDKIDKFNKYMYHNDIRIVDDMGLIDILSDNFGVWDIMGVASEITLTDDWFIFDGGQFSSVKNDIELLMFMNELLLQHV